VKLTRYPTAAFFIVGTALRTMLGCASDTLCGDCGEPYAVSFSSNFDSATEIMDLFPDDGSLWSNIQLVQPDGSDSVDQTVNSFSTGANSVALQSDVAASTPNAVRFDAPPSGDSVSKAALQTEGFEFGDGDDLWCAFDLYVDATNPIVDLFLADFESTEIDGGPGRRLMVSSSEEIILESKANYAGDTLRQDADSIVPLPTKLWVRIIESVRVHLLAKPDRFSGNGAARISGTDNWSQRHQAIPYAV
jgi:hypothetical protein